MGITHSLQSIASPHIASWKYDTDTAVRTGTGEEGGCVINGCDLSADSD